MAYICEDQPHWVMQPEMKRYYLMQMAFWFQQLIVLVLGLEKPRKDFKVLVMHHIVTLWMIWYVLPSFPLHFTGSLIYFRQWRLHDKPDSDRKCGIREHGHSRHAVFGED
jgi:hypothetical protein